MCLSTFLQVWLSCSVEGKIIKVEKRDAKYGTFEMVTCILKHGLLRLIFFFIYKTAGHPLSYFRSSVHHLNNAFPQLPADPQVFVSEATVPQDPVPVSGASALPKPRKSRT